MFAYAVWSGLVWSWRDAMQWIVVQHHHRRHRRMYVDSSRLKFMATEFSLRTSMAAAARSGSVGTHYTMQQNHYLPVTILPNERAKHIFAFVRVFACARVNDKFIATTCADSNFSRTCTLVRMTRIESKFNN